MAMLFSSVSALHHAAFGPFWFLHHLLGDFLRSVLIRWEMGGRDTFPQRDLVKRKARCSFLWRMDALVSVTWGCSWGQHNTPLVCYIYLQNRCHFLRKSFKSSWGGGSSEYQSTNLAHVLKTSIYLCSFLLSSLMWSRLVRPLLSLFFI